MHYAWRIADIYVLIFEHLENTDLARLARTRKTLFDVVVPILWWRLTSFEPFLFCLPPDFRRRPLNTEDLERLDFYASKVRKIVLESENPQTTIHVPKMFKNSRGFYNALRPNPKKTSLLDNKSTLQDSRDVKTWQELWEEIAVLRPQAQFLPNLRSLRLSSTAEALLIPLINISGASLEKVYIKYIHGAKNNVVRHVLNGFQDTPNLEYLFVRDGTDIVNQELIAQSPLKQLRLDPRVYEPGRHSETLFKTGPLRYDILQKASLEHLTIGLTDRWYGTEVLAALERKQKHLPALKTLWLNLTTYVPSPSGLHTPALFSIF